MTVILAVAALGIAVPLAPRLQVPSAPRRTLVPHATAPSANWTLGFGDASLTMGDLMEQYLQRRLESADLGRTKLIWQTEWALDEKLAAGALELDTLRNQFEAGLERIRQNTTRHLTALMQQSESSFLKRYGRTAAALDQILQPTRDAVRADLQRAQREDEARLRQRALGRANSRGYARTRNAMAASGWSRTGKRVTQRTHPVLVTNDASALIISILLLLVVADVASGKLLGGFAEHFALGWGRGHEVAAQCWWLLFGVDLTAYLVSSGIILANAGKEEWATIALGSSADQREAEFAAAGPSPGFVRWQYDWESDKWRQI